MNNGKTDAGHRAMDMVLEFRAHIPSDLFPMVYELAVATDHAERAVALHGAKASAYKWLADFQADGDWVEYMRDVLGVYPSTVCRYFGKAIREAWHTIPDADRRQGRLEVLRPVAGRAQ
jgi:hypothetical protein